MNKEEYITAVKENDIDTEKIKKISELYGQEIVEPIARFISFADNADYIDDERRVLTYKEILSASSDYDVDFVGLGIIPVIDTFDMTFIVYSLSEKIWAKFSTVDKTLFKERKNIEDVI